MVKNRVEIPAVTRHHVQIDDEFLRESPGGMQDLDIGQRMFKPGHGPVVKTHRKRAAKSLLVLKETQLRRDLQLGLADEEAHPVLLLGIKVRMTPVVARLEGRCKARDSCTQ